MIEFWNFLTQKIDDLDETRFFRVKAEVSNFNTTKMFQLKVNTKPQEGPYTNIFVEIVCSTADSHVFITCIDTNNKYGQNNDRYKKFFRINSLDEYKSCIKDFIDLERIEGNEVPGQLEDLENIIL